MSGSRGVDVGITFHPMVSKPSRIGGRTRKLHRGVPTLIGVKGDDYLRQRMRVAVAEGGYRGYADLIADLLDEREKRLERQRRAQPSPLHRPRPMPVGSEEL
jgi:hypothetical protein